MHARPRDGSTWRNLCPSKIFGNLSEFVESGAVLTSERSGGLLKAVAKMIVDEYGLGAFQRLDHRVHLLGNLKAAPATLDHGDGGGKMTVRPLQAIDHIRVRVMSHGPYAIPLEGISQRCSGMGLAAVPLPRNRPISEVLNRYEISGVRKHGIGQEDRGRCRRCRSRWRHRRGCCLQRLQR